MKISFFKTNLSVIQKICLAGLFIALIVILQKVVAINYLAFAPFVRISFGGPALIIFASILLGPIYGGLIGMASDLLGYLIFDPRMYPPYLQITAIYTLLGVAAYFVFSIVFSIKNIKLLSLIEIAVLSFIWLGVSLYVILSNQITLFSSTYDVPLISKILIPIVLAMMFAFIIVFSRLYKPKEEHPLMSPLHICFASFICDLAIIVIFGSIMKAWAFGFATFLAILLTQAMVLFINVTLDTLFICAFQKFTKKYFVSDYGRREEN